MQPIKIFTDWCPYLGPVIWILTIQYFITQLIVAAAWQLAPYSWRFNTISDLGNTACGTFNGRIVCSPLHGLMNMSFVSLGILMATGALFIYQEFRESLATLIGFSLMAIAGFGTILVGLFPENTIGFLHVFGASLPFLLGNIGLIILGLSIFKLPGFLKIFTLMAGTLALIALLFFVSRNYLGLGVGGMERFVAYPQTIWLIFFGLYMSRDHYLKAQVNKTK